MSVLTICASLLNLIQSVLHPTLHRNCFCELYVVIPSGHFSACLFFFFFFIFSIRHSTLLLARLTFLLEDINVFPFLFGFMACNFLTFQLIFLMLAGCSAPRFSTWISLSLWLKGSHMISSIHEMNWQLLYTVSFWK